MKLLFKIDDNSNPKIDIEADGNVGYTNERKNYKYHIEEGQNLSRGYRVIIYRINSNC